MLFSSINTPLTTGPAPFTRYTLPKQSLTGTLIMNAIVIEHVKVAELPEAWRNMIAKPGNTQVTVRIEEEPIAQETSAPPTEDDLLFGMWRDHEELADVDAHIRKLRAPRYAHDGSRSTGS
jgi:hypothetical protein